MASRRRPRQKGRNWELLQASKLVTVPSFCPFAVVSDDESETGGSLNPIGQITEEKSEKVSEKVTGETVDGYLLRW